MPDTLELLNEINMTNREFYRSFRFLTADTRNQVVLAHERNMSLMLNIVRSEFITSQPVRYTVNIPLSSLGGDLSGNFMDPVPVVATRAQIDAAVERHIGVNETCSICQENVTCATRIRRCGHCFHSDCIEQWFTMNTRCPMCRADIRETANRPAPRENILESILRNIGEYEPNDNSRDSDEE